MAGLLNKATVGHIFTMGSNHVWTVDEVKDTSIYQTWVDRLSGSDCELIDYYCVNQFGERGLFMRYKTSGEFIKHVTWHGQA